MKKDSLIQLYQNVLIGIINNADIHTIGRKNKFPIDFYLHYIFRIFFYGDRWNSFDCPSSCDRSTIKKKFYKWNKLGIFDIAYQKLFNKYKRNRTFKLLSKILMVPIKLSNIITKLNPKNN